MEKLARFEKGFLAKAMSHLALLGLVPRAQPVELIIKVRNMVSRRPQLLLKTRLARVDRLLNVQQVLHDELLDHHALDGEAVAI